MHINNEQMKSQLLVTRWAAIVISSFGQDGGLIQQRELNDWWS